MNGIDEGRRAMYTESASKLDQLSPSLFWKIILIMS